MTLISLFNLLGATDNPLLPSAAVMQMALHGVWALLLGSAVLLLAAKLAWPYRWGLAGLVMLWTLLPGAVSPAFWLGLAFQTPSMTSAVLGLGCLVKLARREPGAGVSMTGGPRWGPILLAGLGIVLGWVLLLDTLAWLPVSVYAWGFSSAAVGAVALVAVLFWVVSGAAPVNRSRSGLFAFLLPLVVLVVFVLTRLPTGNVWDALLDPGLWLALQLGGVVSVLRRWRAARRSPAATRA